MFNFTLSYLWSLTSVLQQAVQPCSFPERLLVNSMDHRPFLGTWYFQAAVSFSADHIQEFAALDSLFFTLQEKSNDTLLLTGHKRIGETCSQQNWTYRLRPDREDLVLEGRPQRRTLLWSGSSIRCSGCIILQEIEPALSEMDSEDSLGRFMLYSRKPDGNSEVVATFLKNWDCNGSSESVKPPQKQGFCP